MTGVVALVIAILLISDYLKNKKVYLLAWANSFLVLFVSGVLIILNGYEILTEPLVPAVAAFIPAVLLLVFSLQYGMIIPSDYIIQYSRLSWLLL